MGFSCRRQIDSEKLADAIGYALLPCKSLVTVSSPDPVILVDVPVVWPHKAAHVLDSSPSEIFPSACVVCSMLDPYDRCLLRDAVLHHALIVAQRGTAMSVLTRFVAWR